MPFNHSERLLDTVHKNYQADPLFIKGMGHNNVHASVRPLFIDRLRKYLDRHVMPNIVRNTSSSEMMGVLAPTNHHQGTTPISRMRSKKLARVVVSAR